MELVVKLIIGYDHSAIILSLALKYACNIRHVQDTLKVSELIVEDIESCVFHHLLLLQQAHTNHHHPHGPQGGHEIAPQVLAHLPQYSCGLWKVYTW